MTAVPRARGRMPDQIRALLCELSLLDRADGSARWSQDGTTVLAAVHGPRPVQQRKEDPERAVVEVVFKPRSGLQGPGERECEAIIREALEGVLHLGQFPRTSIMVVLQVLSDDGSVLPTALNAACAALVDAGVPMRCMFSAVACGLIQGDQVLVDPDTSELSRCQQQVVFSFCHKYDSSSASDKTQAAVTVEEGALVCHLSSLPEVVAAQHGTAGVSADQLLDTFDVCRGRCQQIATFMHTAFAKALA